MGFPSLRINLDEEQYTIGESPKFGNEYKKKDDLPNEARVWSKKSYLFLVTFPFFCTSRTPIYRGKVSTLRGGHAANPREKSHATHARTQQTHHASIHQASPRNATSIKRQNTRSRRTLTGDRRLGVPSSAQRTLVAMNAMVMFPEGETNV